MSTEITTQETGITPVMHQAESGLSIFDSGAFEKMLSISEALSKSSLIPETIKGKTPEETAANCLLVVEQSSRWGLSPFAVLQCASVVYGRLMWEGKLVSAVIDAQLGIRLKYEFSGTGKKRKVVVSGKFDNEDEPRTVEGDVSQWETTGKGSPWADPKNHDRQLAYRGAREWSRRHAPAVMLGVITDDETLESGMVNVTNGRKDTQFVRAEPIDPAKAVPEPSETTEPDQAREVRDCVFKGFRHIDEEHRWVATLHNGQRAADMTVIDNDLLTKLETLDANQPVRATFTPSESGVPVLNDVIVIKGEGELI